MNLEIYSVYDSKAAAFLPPFYLPMEGQALRIFQNCANDPTHQFGANPGDYSLFHLGTFDDESAAIKTLATPKNLGLAQEYKEASKIPDPDFNFDKDADIITRDGKEYVALENVTI